MNDGIEQTTETSTQPKPRGTGPTVGDRVQADIAERNSIGEVRYGEKLRAFNGRNSIQDAYEEALDLSQYLKQALLEQEKGVILTAALLAARDLLTSKLVQYPAHGVLQANAVLDVVLGALEAVGIPRSGSNIGSGSLGVPDVRHSRMGDSRVVSFGGNTYPRPSRGYSTGVVLPDESSNSR